MVSCLHPPSQTSALQATVGRLNTLTLMYGSKVKEIRSIAAQLFSEAKRSHPFLYQTCKRQARTGTARIYSKNWECNWEFVRSHLSRIPPEEEPELVRLIDYKDNFQAEVNVISAILYEQAQGQSLHRITNYVKSMPIEERNKVIRTYTEFHAFAVIIDQAGRLKWSIIPSNCLLTLAYSETCIGTEFLRLSGNCSRRNTVMTFLKSWLIQDSTRTLEIACTIKAGL